MKSLCDTIFEATGYKFNNSAILEEALTHPSVNKKDSTGRIISYERLELLGDSVLNMVVSSILLKLFPEEKEGPLAKRKTNLVCGSTIADVAQKIGLNNLIIMNNSERCNGGKCNPRNLENALEALIGAIYIDGGFENVEKFIAKYWKNLAEEMLIPPQDPKTSLQEWTQKQKLPLPEYKLVKQSGLAHRPEFTISVYVENYGEVVACACSKKAAEQEAAESMLKKINNDEKANQPISKTDL